MGLRRLRQIFPYDLPAHVCWFSISEFDWRQQDFLSNHPIGIDEASYGLSGFAMMKPEYAILEAHAADLMTTKRFSSGTKKEQVTKILIDPWA